MSPLDDFPDEMSGYFVGEGTTDALLEGRVEPDEAPAGLQEVATLVLAARSLHANGGLAGENSVSENSVVAAFIESVRAPQATPAPVSPRPRRSAGRFSAKVAGTAAILALGGAAAAAATGSLPAPLQAAVSRNLSHIGIGVPDPQKGTSSSGLVSNAGAGPAGQGRSTALTAPSTTANEYGLCTAYFAPGGVSSTDTTGKSALSSVAFARLTAAATAKGETVQAFCASIPKPGTTTTTAGSDGTSSTDSGGQPAGNTPGSGQSTNPAGGTGGGGQPASNPAGNTPGSGQSTNPVGNTGVSGTPSTNPAGNTPGDGQPATNPSGKTPGSNGQSGTQTTQ